MGFTEKEVSAVQDMFNSLGYEVTEMIFDLGNIERFIIELVPTNRSSGWTMEAMKKLTVNTGTRCTSIWYDGNRIINPMVDRDSIVIKVVGDAAVRLVEEFHKRGDDERREIISSSIFTICTELQLSYWVPELYNPFWTDIYCPETGFAMVSFGPFDGLRYDVVNCPSRCLAGPEVTRANAHENECFITVQNGLMSFNGFHEFNQSGLLLMNTNNSCITVFLSRQQIDESCFNNELAAAWCLDTSKLSKSKMITIHTTIPDGVDTEMSVSIDLSQMPAKCSVIDGNLICSFKGDRTRLMIIPTEYVIGIDWK